MVDKSYLNRRKYEQKNGGKKTRAKRTNIIRGKGFSFEKLCFSHLAQIKRALGIEGIWTKAYAYAGEGVQIDMILERADRCVNVVEIKYLDTPFAITSAYAETLKKRQQVVASLYKKRMTYMTVMITAEGLSRNAFSSSLIQQELTLDALYQ